MTSFRDIFFHKKLQYYLKIRRVQFRRNETLRLVFCVKKKYIKKELSAAVVGMTVRQQAALAHFLPDQLVDPFSEHDGSSFEQF